MHSETFNYLLALEQVGNVFRILKHLRWNFLQKSLAMLI